MTRLIQKTISMPCHPKFMNEVRKLVTETLEGVDLPKPEKEHLVLAVDESVSSMVRYARYKGYQNEISLTLDIDDVRFKVSVADSLNVFDAGRPGDLEKDRSYTLSLSLLRQIMDEITYVYRKGFQNEMELIKFL